MTAIAFPFDWNPGDGPYRKRRDYRTGVITADDGTEQRIKHRRRPARTYAYPLLSLTGSESALLSSLLHDGVRQFAVPLWTDASTLTADKSIGATFLSVASTTDREVGAYLMLWASASNYELVTASGSGPSFTISALTKAWPAGTLVVPCHPGRLTHPLAVGRPFNRGARLAVEFELEVLDLADTSATGTEAVSVMAVDPRGPNRVADPDETWTRLLSRITNQGGSFADYAHDAAPAVTFPHRLFLDSQALIADLWDWYDDRAGRLNPCWVPTFQADLIPTGAIASGDTSLTVSYCGYTVYQFPDESRKHLALIQPDGTVVHRRVTASVDNGDGTETLTLDDAAGADLAAGYGLVSFMRYCRLAEDVLEVPYTRQGFAEVTLQFREIPAETPSTV